MCCGIVPSYVANRRWVWNRPGHGSLTREVLPFWALSLTGLAVSTVAVARVASLTSTWTASSRAVALPVANLSVFAALWVVQFVVLDRVIFRAPRNGAMSSTVIVAAGRRPLGRRAA